MITRLRLTFLITLLCSSLLSGAPQDTIIKKLSHNLVIDLNNPIYSDNVLSTESGGVIQGEGLRIQAEKIRYTKGNLGQSVEAEGNLMLEYEDHVFVGTSLSFNLDTRTGTVRDGRTQFQQWFIGGKVIKLEKDGSYQVTDGFITSNENIESSWAVKAKDMHITKENQLAAEDFKFYIGSIPVLWLPKMETHLSNVFDTPIRYKLQFGGGQGARVGMRYRFISWKDFQAFAQVDYRMKRGAGAAIDTQYKKDQRLFETKNYIAYDTSLLDDYKHRRFRFSGQYNDEWFEKSVTVKARYDRLSDREVVTDFYDSDFNIKTARRTDLLLHHQGEAYNLNLFSRLHINPFQTTLQELPTFSASLLPFLLGKTGIISNSRASVGYLDYAFTKQSTYPDYHSTKAAIYQELYRPIPLNFCTLTPSAEFIGLAYGSNIQVTGHFSCSLNTFARKHYNSFSHSIEPYCNYDYYTTSTHAFQKHPVFDIRDAYVPLNMTTFGIKQNFFRFKKDRLKPFLELNLFSHAYINSPTMNKSIPKFYASSHCYPLDILRVGADTAWDFETKKIDFFNTSIEWTVSADLAFGVEFRHRGPRAWRKADFTNEMLNVYRSETSLLGSSLSDPRDTFLSRMFWRITPQTSLKLHTRNGWNRPSEPAYREWKADLSTIVDNTWKFQVFYLFTQAEKRVGFGISVVDYSKKNNSRFWE